MIWTPDPRYTFLFAVFETELRRRCVEAGYGDILVGACDVLALNKSGALYGVGQGPLLHGYPAVWTIVERYIGRSSGSGHWCQFDWRHRTYMQEIALKSAPYVWAIDHVRPKTVCEAPC